MTATRTPQRVSAPIRNFCASIRSDAEPVFLAIQPDPECEPFECFPCVRRMMERHGGRIQYGWSIWEWPGVYMEAEHHAVYESPDGPPWLDITPSAFSEITHRLFLPDDSAVYDFDNEGVLRDNIRLAIVGDPLIKEFFEAASEGVRIRNTIPGVGLVSVDYETAQQLEAVDEKRSRLVLALSMKYTPQNARCFCGSGKKFKRCHGSIEPPARVCTIAP